MTRTTSPKTLRLAAIEREQRRLADQLTQLNGRFDQVLQLEARNAVLASMNRRLMGERDKFLETIELLKQARKA